MTSKFAKKSTSSDLNETWYDVRGRWDIHDDMTFKVIRGQGQGDPQSPIGTIFILHTSNEETKDIRLRSRLLQLAQFEYMHLCCLLVNHLEYWPTFLFVAYSCQYIYMCHRRSLFVLFLRYACRQTDRQTVRHAHIVMDMFTVIRGRSNLGV